MGYVIQRNDGWYVQPPGMDKSYTTRLQDAWVFSTREEAERNCCPGNERVLSVEDCMRHHD